MPPQITLAIGRDYDRTRPLMDGRVKVEGVDLNPMTLGSVEEVFYRMGRNREFDVAEFSGASYLFMRSRNDPPPFIAIPVFPSKFFRHSCIFVHADSGIREPKDLKGKIMGCPEWLMTAGLWIRGMLKHEYGVDITDLRWRIGGEEEPGRTNQAVGRVEFDLPPGVVLEEIPPDRVLSDMCAKERSTPSCRRAFRRLFTIPGVRCAGSFPTTTRWKRSITGAANFFRSCTSSSSAGMYTRDIPGSRSTSTTPSSRRRRSRSPAFTIPRRSSTGCLGSFRSSKSSARSSAKTTGPTESNRTGRRSRRWSSTRMNKD